MNRRGLFLLLLLQILLPIQSRADVVYPARLEMTEVEPGVFSVRFILPMVNNQYLRANPVLPALCADLSDRETRVTPNEYAEIRRVACSPSLLFGETIAVQGLIGSQTDVILFLDMLDGRSYTATLKPAKAVFVIPHPPSLLDLGIGAGLAGVRRIVRRPEIFLLFFLLTFLGIRRKSVLLSGCMLLLGCAAGQYLFQHLWLQFSSQLSLYVILIAVLLPTLDFLQLGKDPLRWLRPTMLIAFLVGLLLGGSPSESFLIDGLSSVESSLAFFIHMAGIALGLLLGYFLVVEFHRILFLLPSIIPADRRDRLIAYVIGTLTTAFLLYSLGALLILPSVIPQAPGEFYVLAIGLGLWLGLPGAPTKGLPSLFLLIPLVAGFFLGHSEITLPLGPLLVSGTLFLSGVAIMTERFKGQGLSLSILVMALLYHGWNSAAFIDGNLSLPIAVSIGAATVGILIFLFARNAVALNNWSRGTPILRISGGGVALAAVTLRVGDYADWFERGLAGEMAMGFVRIPALALGLLVAAGLIWPRRRRIQEILDFRMRKPVLHFSLLVLSFYVLPFGTIRVRNPFHDPSAPTGDSARRILTQVLSNTYHAFNLDDEEELYDRLSETVSGGLVEDVYLDSRRKLTSGVREGAEVTVRDVNVVWVGGEVEGSNAVEGYSYECRWSVLARVRHLQHVHHRQNTYTGLLRLQAIDDGWKIGEITLIGEDRVIIPWTSG